MKDTMILLLLILSSHLLLGSEAWKTSRVALVVWGYLPR